MAGGSPERQHEIERLVTTWTAPAMAAVLVDIAGVLGATEEWDDETPDAVYQVLRPLFASDDRNPSRYQTVRFWERVTGQVANNSDTDDDDDF